MNQTEKRSTWVDRFHRTHGIVALSIAALLFAGMGVREHSKNVELNRQVNASYQHALTELADYVANIETLLSKVMVTNNENQIILLSADLWRESAFAKASLGQLPVASTELDKTATFLSQVGDYAYSLSRKMMNEQQVTDEEWSQLEGLSEHASTLTTTLQNMEIAMLNGQLNFQAASDELGGNRQVFAAQMEDVEKKFAEYVALIYDGPFSEHMLNKEPAIKDVPEISEEEAKGIAMRFTGLSGVESVSQSEGNMPTYDCLMNTGDEGRQVMVEVTKNGGFVRLLTDSRLAGERQISMEEAQQKATECLAQNGFQNMEQTGYVIVGNSVDFAFAPVQDGCTMYSDLVKVRIALDNGSVSGFEAHGYYTNHVQNRQLPNPTVTEEEVRAMMKPAVAVQSVRRCQIPLESGEEVYCYELKVQYKERTFLIYVNMENGREEKILMVEDSENGALTI